MWTTTNMAMIVPVTAMVALRTRCEAHTGVRRLRRGGNASPTGRATSGAWAAMGVIVTRPSLADAEELITMITKTLILA